MISWLVNRHRRNNPVFNILGKVPRGEPFISLVQIHYSTPVPSARPSSFPRFCVTAAAHWFSGFQNVTVPKVNKMIVETFANELPASVIVLLIEHIAISKSFGRVNNYTIDPSQELVAIGVTNLLGPFLGAYPATGSFSRTAVKSKAGVRTPLAGIITAIVVLLAIYALPAVFFYIPSASLSGVIIHAVGDLITPPHTVYKFWRVSPLEVFIFSIGVYVTIFSSIENGIYCTICVSLGLLLFHFVKAQGQFLGRVKVHSVVGDRVLDSDGKYGALWTSDSNGSSARESALRNIFLPINHNDGSNPEIDAEQADPGIFIYRFTEGFKYPNASHCLDKLVSTIYKETRRTKLDNYPRLGDRPWNDPGPRRGQAEEDRSHLPILKGVILDFSSVNYVDVTSIQSLIDVRNQLDRYAAPQPVQWHFAHVNNRWTKRALVSAGFGFLTPASSPGFARRKSIFSVTQVGGSNSAAADAELVDKERNLQLPSPETGDLEGGGGNSDTNGNGDVTEDGVPVSGRISGPPFSDKSSLWLLKELGSSKVYGKTYGATKDRRIKAVHGVNMPFFHTDLTSALQAAMADPEAHVYNPRLG
jgi:sodium-independent sulfate anion transporter 11